VEFEGEKVPAEELEVTTQSEPWAMYVLEDGTHLKIKSVLAKAFRVIDRYQPNGDPVYGLQIGSLPIFTIAPNLLRPPQPDSDKSE